VLSVCAHATPAAVSTPGALRLATAVATSGLGGGTVAAPPDARVPAGPDLRQAEPVRDSHLLERALVNSPLGLRIPRARHGNLVEDSELHSPPPGVICSIVAAYWIVSLVAASMSDAR